MTTREKERVLKDPALTPGDEPYFEAAAQGRLLLKSCRECGEVHHFPRAICPFCWSSDVHWKDAEGFATIYSFSISRRGSEGPFCVAYVTLDEGPTMLTNIVDTDLDSVQIGQRVRVVFRNSEGGFAIPLFTPLI